MAEIAVAAIGVFAVFAMGGGWTACVLILIAAAGVAIWIKRRSG